MKKCVGDSSVAHTLIKTKFSTTSLWKEILPNSFVSDLCQHYHLEISMFPIFLPKLYMKHNSSVNTKTGVQI